MDCNIPNLMHHRRIEDKFNRNYKKALYATKSFISRLGLEFELEGHEGCINCLEWNQSGTILASGSDDLKIILWNPLEHKLIQSYESYHDSNIFSVKFLPNSNDKTLITGAADYKVIVTDLNYKTLVLLCGCHNGRVKRIAVTPSESHLFWSAGEDGFIMQYDMRMQHACSEICSNVLINLNQHLGRGAEAKCLAINHMKPEILAVGANDPYIRLYDRRMISTSRIVYPSPSGIRPPWERVAEFSPDPESPIPIGAVQYFVAGHLPQKQMDYKKRYRTLASTYLTFSPDGSELLANLGGEQIYLFSLSNPCQPTSEEVLSMKDLTNGFISSINGYKEKNSKTSFEVLPDVVESIKQCANEHYDKEKYTLAITLYNQAINMCPNASVLYGNRAVSLMKRGWDGDMYSALKDCWKSIQLDPTYYKAHFRLIRCLYELHWTERASDLLKIFKEKFPRQAKTQACALLQKDLSAAFTTENKPGVNINNNSKSNVSNNISESETLFRQLAYDYETRFCGHCNTTTDIKEANYFGLDGQYIIAGSDDGSIFIWDRKTTNIVRVLHGDDSIVNCLQPHPDMCLLATSGIDNVIRLWSPRPEDGSIESRIVDDHVNAARVNQKRMNADPVEAMLLNIGLPTRTEDFDSGVLPPCHTS